MEKGRGVFVCGRRLYGGEFREGRGEGGLKKNDRIFFLCFVGFILVVLFYFVLNRIV